MNKSIEIKNSLVSHQAALLSLIFLTTFTTTTQAEGLGRLFTTPQERAMLERARHTTSIQIELKKEPETTEQIDTGNFNPDIQGTPSETNIEVVIIDTDIVEPEVIILPEQKIPNITVNGFVKRSGGKSTAWVNGINTNDGYFEPQHIKVNPHKVGHDHVHIEVDDLTIGDVSLKAGQTLNSETAEVTETYQVIQNSDTQ